MQVAQVRTRLQRREDEMICNMTQSVRVYCGNGLFQLLRERERGRRREKEREREKGEDQEKGRGKEKEKERGRLRLR